MSLNRIILLFLFFNSSLISAMVMEDEPKSSLRLYVNSVKIKEATDVRSQRYGGMLMFKTPLPFASRSTKKRVGMGLDLEAEPDLTKKSGEVNILQDFYTLDAFLECNYVLLFRFSVLAGPGALLSVTRANVVNTKETHTEFSSIANAGFSIDYAIDRRWEIGWQIRARYRFHNEKVDWLHGFGLIFNF